VATDVGFYAVREETRTAFAEIQPPRVDFRERRHEPGRRLPFGRREALHLREQVAIQEIVERTNCRDEEVQIAGK
jgi:hypothetical protein